MEPRIQYATTADGISIAFSTLGEGMPLVVVPAITSSMEAQWQVPESRRLSERLAQNRMLVSYDRRGTGASERNVTDYSLDSHVLDIEAVVDRLGLDRFALMGLFFSGPVTIAYTARHPERVSHLLLWCTWARGSDYLALPQVQAVRALVDKDWEFFTESWGHFLTGWSAGSQARQAAYLTRESITQQALQATFDAMEGFDVADILPKVASPTLVFHCRHIPYPHLDVARGLASGIPNARLALLEGSSFLPSGEDMEPVVAAID